MGFGEMILEIPKIISIFVSKTREFIMEIKKENALIGYKGFHKNLTCYGGFQYEVGQEYENCKKIWACGNGFHACKNPIDVLNYYSNIDDRYCIVEQWGYVDKEGDKTASSNIKIVKEISLRELFDVGWKYYIRKIGGAAIFGIEGDDYNLLQFGVKRTSLFANRCNMLYPSPSTKDIIGNDNIIGILGCNGIYNITGEGNLIYVLGDDNTININTEHDCVVRVLGANGNDIRVTGEGCDIWSDTQISAACIGRYHTVNAEEGSHITLIDGRKVKTNE